MTSRDGFSATEWGRQLYLKRRAMVESVFGQIKRNLGFRRFSHRGRSAVRSEWRAVHNPSKNSTQHRPQAA